jgi:hypothetical protein
MFGRAPSRIFLLAACMALLAAPDAAAKPDGTQTSLGTFGAWRTFMYTESKQNVCYMAATVPSTKNKKFKRGAAHLMITHRPAENSNNVVSFTAGYNFKPVSDVEIRVGKSHFSLFTAKDTAWARDAAGDRALTAAIRNNSKLTITGIPAAKIKGVATITDTVDLTGASKAYVAIGKACGLEPTPKPNPAVHKKQKK